LECHPDKKLVGVDDPDEKQRIEDHFKLVQEAYDTLSDPAKRREYDSTDEFDDSLPMECEPADFFKVGLAVHSLKNEVSSKSDRPNFDLQRTDWVTN
jgi:DnaJ family protein C protein 2